SASICAVAGLARETNVLSLFGLIDSAEWKSARSIAQQAALVALGLLPLAIWFDYIHSIYRSQIFTSGETLARPFAGILGRASVAFHQFGGGANSRAPISALMVVAFVTQIGFLVARPPWHEPWWRIGIAYAALLPLLGQPLWSGTPPTAIRVE